MQAIHRLQDQGGFANAGVAANQHHAAFDDAAAAVYPTIYAKRRQMGGPAGGLDMQIEAAGGRMLGAVMTNSKTYLAPWLERLPGRLLHTNIIGSTIFAAVSGSSAATAASSRTGAPARRAMTSRRR